jgi:formyltetrahydrofolate hydrolase
VESDLEAPERRSGTLLADRAFDDRYRDIGRLQITCPDRPGIVAAVSRAEGWHLEDRVIVHQNKTIGFA